jgi:hypothetical protein
MPISRPRNRKPHKTIPIPPGFPHFIGYHGTKQKIAEKLLKLHEVDIDPTEIIGRGDLGSGLYIASTQSTAKLFAQRNKELTGKRSKVLKSLTR